eukprot:s3492_g6.t2
MFLVTHCTHHWSKDEHLNSILHGVTVRLPGECFWWHLRRLRNACRGLPVPVPVVLGAHNTVWLQRVSTALKPVIYTFVLGCGQHSVKQYRVELRKACHEGLREAGLSEDRHASDGAIGKFKSIDDKDHGMHMIRVFPKRSADQPTRPTEATEKSMEEDLAEIQVDNARAMGCHVDHYSMLGLCEFLSTLLPILRAGLNGKKLLSDGSEPEILQLRAFESLEELQGIWSRGFKALRAMLFGSSKTTTVTISSETKSAFLALMDLVELQSKSSAASEMRQMIQDFAVDDRNPSAKGLVEKERELKKILDKQCRADELNAQLAEMKQQLHSAARWKTGVAPPQDLPTKNRWNRRENVEATQRSSKENEWTSPVRSGGYGSPGSSSPSWIGGTEKIADKARMNISPSAASTTVPWEVTMSDAFGLSGHSPQTGATTVPVPRVDSPQRLREQPDSQDWLSFYHRWMEDQESFQLGTESQEKLLKAAKWAAKQIGPGHEAVEAAKRQLQHLRSRQHQMRFKSNLRWHKANLAFELQQLALMEVYKDESFKASVSAAELDLGPAHEVVANARRMAQMLKMQKVEKARKAREAAQDLQLRAAAESKDLHVLAGSIQAAAQKLGPAHDIVERGRQEFLQQRRELQRRQWEECVRLQQALMVEACESQDPELIEARILAASHSPLGQGHEIVLYGKRYLLWLRRAMQRNALEARQCRAVKVLQEASREATEADLRSLERHRGVR